jgi:hypothetical protein
MWYVESNGQQKYLNDVMKTIIMYKYYILLEPPLPALPSDADVAFPTLLALQAPESQIPVLERQRRAFWTACLSYRKRENIS